MISGYALDPKTKMSREQNGNRSSCWDFDFSASW